MKGRFLSSSKINRRSSVEQSMCLSLRKELDRVMETATAMRLRRMYVTRYCSQHNNALPQLS